MSASLPMASARQGMCRYSVCMRGPIPMQNKPLALKLGRRWHNHGVPQGGVFPVFRSRNGMQNFLRRSTTDMEEVGGKPLRELQEVLQVDAHCIVQGLFPRVKHCWHSHHSRHKLESSALVTPHLHRPIHTFLATCRHCSSTSLLLHV